MHTSTHTGHTNTQIPTHTYTRHGPCLQVEMVAALVSAASGEGPVMARVRRSRHRADTASQAAPASVCKWEVTATMGGHTDTNGSMLDTRWVTEEKAHATSWGERGAGGLSRHAHTHTHGRRRHSKHMHTCTHPQAPPQTGTHTVAHMVAHTHTHTHLQDDE